MGELLFATGAEDVLTGIPSAPRVHRLAELDELLARTTAGQLHLSATAATEGELVPILVDSLGEPVVARWTAGDGQQIWYVSPHRVDWNQVVAWLIQCALPGYVPAALRRVRSRHHLDPALETPAETRAAALLKSWSAATWRTRAA
ncbi:hypothetical protein [Streptomyces griseoluteus]|uniref:hypothetical protein n=1 Tax=Streptomyces griseoluteus TaxID=29306 RepID=UPI0036FD0BB9